MSATRGTPQRLSGLVIGLLALGAAACNDGETTGPASGVLTQAEAEEMAQVMAEDMDAFSDAST